MSLRRFTGLLAAALMAVACDEPDSGVDIVDSRIFRADGRVVVEVELLAHERLGDNVGTYCTRVTFTGQTNVFEECHADLEDGDSRTIRATSEFNLDEGTLVVVRVRHAARDVGRSLLAPRP